MLHEAKSAEGCAETVLGIEREDEDASGRGEELEVGVGLRLRSFTIVDASRATRSGRVEEKRRGRTRSILPL